MNEMPPNRALAPQCLTFQSPANQSVFGIHATPPCGSGKCALAGPRTLDVGPWPTETVIPLDACRPVPVAPESARLVRAIQEILATLYDISVDLLCCTTRGPARAATARQVAMYLSHVSLSLSHDQIGQLFGRNRSTATYACRTIEERRDDPAFDGVVSALELLVQTMKREWASVDVLRSA